uniref:Borealin N-terminal domain-containing protein n=1 Tax=Echeneis naucrates TaxID=173247 RepID=A0A665XFP5_ECHNA
EDKMPLRRTKNPGRGQSKEQLDREMRLSRLALFIQQVEKEAEEHMDELAAKLENMTATVDKIFKVEMMKMPPSLKNSRIGDLISGQSKFFFPQNNNSLIRCVMCLFSLLHQTVLCVRGGHLSKGSTVTIKRTQSRLTKTNDQTVPTKPKLRFVLFNLLVFVSSATKGCLLEILNSEEVIFFFFFFFLALVLFQVCRLCW